MKAVILAGGLGTRLSEETIMKPKPMVEVGGMPVIWHIMKNYAAYDVRDFIILGGYKSHIIKEFFRDYMMRFSSVRFEMRDQKMEILESSSEEWSVTVLNTGETTNTGGRLLRAREHIGDDPFFFTYGDGVSNVNFNELKQEHEKSGVAVTLTAVQPPGRFGALSFAEDPRLIAQFQEKPQGDGAWINGGFFMVNPEAIDTISGDAIAWEEQPLRMLAENKQLGAYRHRGFWQSMDTLRDKQYLESLWDQGNAPWKVW